MNCTVCGSQHYVQEQPSLSIELTETNTIAWIAESHRPWHCAGCGREIIQHAEPDLFQRLDSAAAATRFMPSTIERKQTTPN